MTHAEIDELPAGRKLNAVVAEMMGICLYCQNTANLSDGYAGQSCILQKDNTWHCGRHDKPLRPIGDCSTLISAAWEVLHLGHPCGWFDAYSLYRYGNGYAIQKIYNPKNEQATVAPTAPLVICRAFLKATLEEL